MSIAISVLVHPSKIAQSCALLFSSLLVAISVIIGCSNIPSLLIRALLIGLCIAVSLQNFLYARKTASKKWHISVNNQGQFRCLSNPLSFTSSESTMNTMQLLHESDPYYLVTGTTLWSYALFLRLHRPEDDVMINLVVISDALNNNDFRRLSVACRWIVAHADSTIS